MRASAPAVRWSRLASLRVQREMDLQIVHVDGQLLDREIGDVEQDVGLVVPLHRLHGDR